MNHLAVHARALLPLALAMLPAGAAAQELSKMAPPAMVPVTMRALHGQTTVTVMTPFLGLVVDPVSQSAKPAADTIRPLVGFRHSESGAACTKVRSVSARLLDGTPNPPHQHNPDGTDGPPLVDFRAADVGDTCSFSVQLFVIVGLPWWTANRFLPACTPERLRTGWTGMVDMGRLRLDLNYTQTPDAPNIPPDMLVIPSVLARVTCPALTPGQLVPRRP